VIAIVRGPFLPAAAPDMPAQQRTQASTEVRRLDYRRHELRRKRMAGERGGNGAGVVTKLSSRSVADTVSRLTDMIGAKGMKVFAVIDQAAAAKEAGLALRETVLVVFGNPAAGTLVMQAAPESALDLPLKVLVWDDAGQTKVMYVSPTALAERYGLGPELAVKLAGIDPLTDALVKP
jgi:uncharacterized protein (DUF302 family)